MENGDELYAKELACYFTNVSVDSVNHTKEILKFIPEYGFIFKRLPVWRVYFNDEEYFHATVDTKHSHLSVKTNISDVVELISFLNLHKFHFMDPLGKSTRHILSIVATSLILIITYFGILLYYKKDRV